MKHKVAQKYIPRLVVLLEDWVISRASMVWLRGILPWKMVSRQNFLQKRCSKDYQREFKPKKEFLYMIIAATSINLHLDDILGAVAGGHLWLTDTTTKITNFVARLTTWIHTNGWMVWIHKFVSKEVISCERWQSHWPTCHSKITLEILHFFMPIPTSR